AKNHVDLSADWKKQLAKIASDPKSQSGIESWKMAVATAYDGKNITISFANGTSGTIPYDGYKWARPELANQTWGAVPDRPQLVVKPGDVLYVEAEGKPGEY